MGKSVYIAEKPSVAQEFAKALKLNTKRRDGYLESDEAIVTWCVGHLVTMSYPEEYDPALKRWNLQTLPFIPEEFKYEVIPSVAKQFQIVSGILNREDVDTIYVCTDSGREGEYIYRLVEQEAHVEGKKRRRVWIDSQTEEEILRGIREAKDLSEYDNLSASAYLRAKEDYLMGINFSRLLTLKYGNSISNFLHTQYSVVSVGRVMTCVLGMVVRREREIRDFIKTPFYRVLSTIDAQGHTFEGEWRAVKGSRYFESYDLYKENGFKERKKAEELIQYLQTPDDESVNVAGIQGQSGLNCRIESIEKRKRRRILLFYITWRSFRTTVLRDLRSVRMRHCESCRNCMRKTCDLSKNGCPCSVYRSGKGNHKKSERAVKISDGGTVYAGYLEFRKL